MKIINISSKFKAPIRRPKLIGLVPVKKKESVKYSCNIEKCRTDLEIIDVPRTAKKLLLVLDKPTTSRKIFDILAWEVISPKHSEYVSNKNTRIKESDTTEKAGNLLGQLCRPKFAAYKILVFALDNAPGLNASTKIDQVQQVIRDHTIDSASALAFYNKEKKRFLFNPF